MADDVVGVDVVDDDTEEAVVTADELDSKDAADEVEGEADEDAAEVADNIGLELEIDDAGGWFGLLHLDRKPTSQRNP